MKSILREKNQLRIIEVHSALSAYIASSASFENKEFHGFWSSSLCDSTTLMLPDTEYVSIRERLNTIKEISRVSVKPVIVDIDTGGAIDHLKINVANLKNNNVKAVVIEDKTGSKKNSFISTGHTRESVENFCNKIKSIEALQNDDFMIFSRIESFNLGQGLEDALDRARAYIDAGSAGIMIHDKIESPNRIYQFANELAKFSSTPIMCVPTTYYKVKESELFNNGISIVVYANQMSRAATQAIIAVSECILQQDGLAQVEENIFPLDSFLKLANK